MTGVKNSIWCFKSRLDHYKERIYNPEDRTFVITQNKKKQESKRVKKAYGLIGVKKKLYPHYGNSKRRRKREQDRKYI